MTAINVNAVIELTAVWMHTPGLNATTEELRAWYQAKGEMHERLAGRDNPDATELAHAASAFEHARRLTGGGQ